MSDSDPECSLETGNLTTLILLLVLPTFIGIALIYVIIEFFRFLGVKRGLRYYRAYTIMVVTVVLMFWFGLMSYGVF